MDDSFGFGLPKIKIGKPKITINTKQPLKTVSKAAGTYLHVINPLTYVKAIGTNVPVLKDIYRETDKFTGGTISSLVRVTDLPSKFLISGKVSKAELLEALTVALKVGAIVASGGSAGAIIAVSSSQLKQGPLGQSALGREILTLGEIAGTAYAISSAASSQVASQSTNQVSAEAGKEIAKDSVSEAVAGQIKTRAKTEVEKQFEKKTGIPVGVASKIYDVSSGKTNIATVPKDILKKVSSDQLKKAGLSDAMTQAILSNNAKALGVAIKDVPNLAIDKAKRDLASATLKAKETLTVAGLQKLAKEKADKAIAKAKDVDALNNKIASMAEGELKKQNQKLLAEALKQLGLSQKEAIDAAYNLKIGSAKAALIVSASEEGRYVISPIPMILGLTALLGLGTFYLLKKKKL
jgi:LPXTG-motif cell wall-anchored protein